MHLDLLLWDLPCVTHCLCCNQQIRRPSQEGGKTRGANPMCQTELAQKLTSSCQAGVQESSLDGAAGVGVDPVFSRYCSQLHTYRTLHTLHHHEFILLTVLVQYSTRRQRMLPVFLSPCTTAQSHCSISMQLCCLRCFTCVVFPGNTVC
jgi:hypothetical protein